MEKELRRQQNNLVMAGAGVILFGIWSAVKTAMMCILDYSHFFSFLEDATDDIPKDMSPQTYMIILRIIVFLTIIITVLISMLFRLKIGQAAIAEGRGQNTDTGSFYLVAAAFLLLVSVLVVGYTIYGIFFGPPQKGGFSAEDNIVSLLIEITSLCNLIQLISSALNVRKLSKETENCT